MNSSDKQDQQREQVLEQKVFAKNAQKMKLTTSILSWLDDSAP